MVGARAAIATGLLWVLPQILLGAPGAAAKTIGQEPQLLMQLQAIDVRLVRAEAALAQGDVEVSVAQRALARAEAQRSQSETGYRKAQARYGRRLGALTRLSPDAYVTALASIGDLASLTDDEQLMAAIARHDRKLYSAHEAAHRQLLETIAMAEEQAHRAQAAQDRRREARDALARARRRKERTLKQWRQHNAQKTLAPELRLAQVQLQRTLARTSDAQEAGGPEAQDNMPPGAPMALAAQNNRAGRKRLALPWPASGRVRIAFGQHTEAQFGTATYHNGWDIAAAAGSEVTAIASGKVAYAHWLPGYGQVAIVEHPDGFHTVHGHLGRLAVREGQRVRAGQALGTVGDTGSLRGTVLYFEIRHRGVPQDPKLYLSRR